MISKISPKKLESPYGKREQRNLTMIQENLAFVAKWYLSTF